MYLTCYYTQLQISFENKFHTFLDLFADQTITKLVEGQHTFYKWRQQNDPSYVITLRAMLEKDAHLDLDGGGIDKNKYTLNFWMFPVRPNTNLDKLMPANTFDKELESLFNKDYIDRDTALAVQNACVQLHEVFCQNRFLPASDVSFYRGGALIDGWIQMHTDYFVYNVRFYRDDLEYAMNHVVDYAGSKQLLDKAKEAHYYSQCVLQTLLCSYAVYKALDDDYTTLCTRGCLVRDGADVPMGAPMVSSEMPTEAEMLARIEQADLNVSSVDFLLKDEGFLALYKKSNVYRAMEDFVSVRGGLTCSILKRYVDEVSKLVVSWYRAAYEKLSANQDGTTTLRVPDIKETLARYFLNHVKAGVKMMDGAEKNVRIENDHSDEVYENVMEHYTPTRKTFNIVHRLYREAAFMAQLHMPKPRNELLEEYRVYLVNKKGVPASLVDMD